MTDDFWSASPQLQSVLDAARTRHVGPWAVFGAVLAYVCSRVGPHVVLPPIVGGPASLNLFAGLVGPSGAGKDAARDVAAELLNLDGDGVPTHEVGTGQGIDSAYTEQSNKAGPVQFCDAALFTATEIDTLAAHAAMGGATLMPTLRKVYSGAELGARYADKFKRRPVGKHRYRAALIAGIQPARSGVLLNDSDGGTPQRWLWLPVNDPVAASGAPGVDPFDSATGDPWHSIWQRYEWHAPFGDTGELAAVQAKPRHEIEVCDTARQAILAVRTQSLAAPLTGSGGAADGHRLLTQLKVAAMLSFLHRGDGKVTDDDWTLADAVMTVSRDTRNVCAAALAANIRGANVERANLDADRADILFDRTNDRQVSAAGKAIMKRLTFRESGQWCSQGDLSREVNSRHRDYCADAVAMLVAGGAVEHRVTDGRHEYRCVEFG